MSVCLNPGNVAFDCLVKVVCATFWHYFLLLVVST